MSGYDDKFNDPSDLEENSGENTGESPQGVCQEILQSLRNRDRERQELANDEALDLLKREVGRSPDLNLSSKDIYKNYKTPCVYIWIRDDKLIYIGFSGKGFNRFLNENHQALKYLHQSDMELGDRLLVWRFDNPQDAFDTEQRLIFKLAPLFNKQVETQYQGKLNEAFKRKIKICNNCDTKAAEIKSLKKEIKVLRSKIYWRGVPHKTK